MPIPRDSNRANASNSFCGLFLRPWIQATALVLVAFAIALAFRLPDYNKWQDPSLTVNGEYIMATHDAYLWLAGAKGVGAAVGTPMAELARFFADMFNVGLDRVGLWAPAVAAGITAGAVALWGWSLAGLGAGFFAGVLGVLGAGYFFRTRLGFYDTDIITLFFPVFVAWLLAFWLKRLIDRSWPARLKGLLLYLGSAKRQRGKDSQPVAKVRGKKKRHAAAATTTDNCAPPPSPSYESVRPELLYGIPVLAGLMGGWAGIWHGQLANFMVALLVGTLVLGLLLAQRGTRAQLIWGGVLFCLAAYEGLAGSAAAVILVSVFWRGGEKGRRVSSSLLLAALCLAVLLYRIDTFQIIFQRIAGMFLIYGNTSAQAPSDPGDAIVYPNIINSVIEAQRLPLEAVLNKIHPWVPLVWLGAIGFVAVCVVRPEALLLMPLLILALSSPRLGIRMAMFGGPCIALGFAVPVAWALHRIHLQVRPALRRAGEAALWVVLTWGIAGPFITFYPLLPATPVLNKPHIKALTALESIAPKDSMVWTWWDWGFATQYYAGLRSFGDGAKHAGPTIFPLGMVLGTPRPLQSNQVMKYLALNNYALNQGWKSNDMAGARHDLQLLANVDLGLNVPEKQYLVLTYENLRLINWIVFYGTWNLETRTGTHPKTSMLRGQVKVDTKLGEVFNKTLGDKPIRLRSVDVLTKEGRQYIDFPQNRSDLHLILNQATGEHHIMDDLAYGSMMVQGLLAKSDNPALNKYFKVVYDDFPNVRILEAR